MAQYCTIKPKVRVNNEVQDSVLFDRLKTYTLNDYTSAKNIYLSAIHNMADNYKGETPLPLNSQGELELHAILQNFDVRAMLPKDFEKKLLSKFNLEEQPYSVANYTDLLQKCEELNNSIYNNNYFATISIEHGRIVPSVKWKNTKNAYSKEQENQSRSAKLSKKMMDLCTRWGIGVDVLHEAEERLSNGMVDFSSIEKAADGLYHIIRIAKGDRGIAALPEELGHVVVTAMVDNPLMKRVLNIVKSKNLAKEILGDSYQEYSRRYEDDADMLAEEAVGKLMAMHFLQQLGIEDDAIYKQLLNRTVNQAKSFFSKFNEAEISNAINEVNDNLSLITKNLIDNDEELKLSSRALNKIYYQASLTQEQIDRLKKSVVRILKVENKRLTIYKTAQNYTFLKELNDKIKNGDYEDTILTFLNETAERIKELSQELNTLNVSTSSDLNAKAGKLRYFRNTIYSYLKLLQELNSDVKNDLASVNPIFDDTVVDLISQEASLIADCLSEYNRHSIKLVEDYFIPMLGDKMIMDKGWFKKNPIKYTGKQILEMDVHDISLFDMFTDSASDTSSYLIKGVDKVVKRQHNNARLLAIEFMQKVAARTKELEKQGYTDQKWMFEKDDQGKRTGYYISRYNRGKRDQAREAYRQTLLNQYTEEEQKKPEVQNLIRNQLIAWDKAHPITNYKNQDYDRLTDVQKKYLTDIMQWKFELDRLLPGDINSYNTIKIRKDLLERVKSSHSLKDGLKAFSDSIKEGFIRDSTETEFGIKTVLTDFEGNTYRELPVFYQTRGKDVSEEDISTDIVSTMSAYALMAYENYEMSKIINILETLRSKIRDANNPYKTSGSQRYVEVFSTGNQSYVRSENNRILERLNELFDMQIYRTKHRDEGTVAGVDKQKAVGVITQWSSATTMAFNILNNISNVMTGNIQFKIEAVGGQFFNYKNALRADKLYHQHLAEFLTDLTNKTKSSWLWTVGTTFGVMQDYPEMLKDVKFDKKFYERLSMNGISMLLQHAGEFWMQHRTFFSLMDSDKEALTDSKGNKIKAIDAFEVKPIDPKNPKSGSQVVFKRGLTTKNGEKLITKEELKERAIKEQKMITDDSLIQPGEISEYDYIHKMSKKSGKLNDRMHGVYNEEEKAVMYTRSWGRLVGQYRKWIKPSLNRRFKATQYDYDLEAVTEGTYRTAARAIGSIVRHVKEKEFSIIVDYAKDVFRKNPKHLEDYEASNLRQVAAEIGTFALILLCLGLIPDDDDEIRDSYFFRVYEFELYRLKNEIGTLIPSPYMLQEGLKVVQSPAAAISLLDRASDAFTLVTPWNWKEIKRGRYAGWYTPFNTIADLVPYNRAIYRSLHPEQAVAFYK